MKIKTNTLIGFPLNWAVAMCQGCYNLRLVSTYDNNTAWQYTVTDAEDANREYDVYLADTDYLNDWALSGPIIEQEELSVGHARQSPNWFSSTSEEEATYYYGPTLLIAAMRCYVASKLGDEVEIPEGLYA